MKIIDAHLHLFPTQEAWAEEAAQAVGHHNDLDHLREVYGQLGMVHGVVMGNRSLETGWTAWCWAGERPSPVTSPTRWRST